MRDSVVCCAQVTIFVKIFMPSHYAHQSDTLVAHRSTAGLPQPGETPMMPSVSRNSHIIGGALEFGGKAPHQPGEELLVVHGGC